MGGERNDASAAINLMLIYPLSFACIVSNAGFYFGDSKDCCPIKGLGTDRLMLTALTSSHKSLLQYAPSRRAGFYKWTPLSPYSHSLLPQYTRSPKSLWTPTQLNDITVIALSLKCLATHCKPQCLEILLL